ncbi:MAG: thymidine phosphorylase [Pseudomonadota bacterium]
MTTTGAGDPPSAEASTPGSFQEFIRAKREGEVLGDAEIEQIVGAIADGSAADAQLGAFAMAVVLKGMTTHECTVLTRAMTRSGVMLDWSDLPGPCLDKHSTGGVGDKVSLLLAPMLAACGAFVPMISGRGLGHTGGTLDKLEAIEGLKTELEAEDIRRVTRTCGLAIVGATPDIAPADARLYGIRDVTATVESVALITASILSKKLAAGVGALVMDVKVGNGAFMPGLDAGRTLAASIVSVANDAGLPCRALLSDMNQVLGHSAGNAVEIREAIAFLTGARRDPRLAEVTLALGSELLVLGGLAQTPGEARGRLQASLDEGRAADRFARMVDGQGGVAGLLTQPDRCLPTAPVIVDVLADTSGYVHQIDTRALGRIVVELGGGREVPGARIDASVGLDEVVGSGVAVTPGDRLARVHATDRDAARRAASRVLASIRLAADRVTTAEVVRETVGD